MNGLRFLIALCCLFFGSMTMADDESLENRTPMEVTGPLEAGNNNWLLDRTYSSFGDRFFQAFSQSWQGKLARGPFIIVVEESRDPFFAHKMRITVNDRLLAQAVFYPNQAPGVPGLGVRTADYAYIRLQEMLKTLQESSL